MSEDLEQRVAQHYSEGGLYGRILEVLAANGIAEDQMAAEHVAGIDEFHIGGGAATEHLLDPLGLSTESRVLDIGSGVGGAARHMARRYGAQVTGIDLTEDYVDAARRISAQLGVEVGFQQGSAVDLPFDAASFDLATMLHVGMNIEDKPGLFAEAARVLRPGGRFAVYDVMRLGDHPDFPLPWSSQPETSFLESPDSYLSAASAAGFTVEHHEPRAEVAKAFFAAMQERMAQQGPPVLGPPLLMGETAPVKVQNMIAAVQAGDIAPVEMVFRLPG